MQFASIQSYFTLDASWLACSIGRLRISQGITSTMLAIESQSREHAFTVPESWNKIWALLRLSA